MSKRLSVVLFSAALAACGSARQQNVGTTSAEVACTRCHGDPARLGRAPIQAAPPASPSGGNGGAHLAHLERGVACGSCHVVPTSPDHRNGVVEVTFSGLAIKGGAVPTYSGGLNGTCSGVYCHGATLDAGGKLASPAWNDGALRCDACHGAPPAKNHDASSTACATCHPGTVKPDGSINVAGGLHANGTVEASTTHAAGWSDPTKHGYAAKTGLSTCRSCHGQNLDGVGATASSCARCHAADGYASWQSNCTFCHGARITTYDAGSLQKAAPPKGNQGDTSTSARAVGAHQKHLAGGVIGPAVDCAECHVVPTDLTHLDGSAAVTFGATARRDGARPVWTGATCASVYCHGGTLAGGSNNAPSWTSGSSQTTCGTCHGVPPPAPHASSTACEQCHTGYTATTVNATLHLDGKIDATAQHPTGWAARDLHGYAANRKGLSTCAACHGADYAGGSSGVSCNSCHASSGWATWQTNCTFCHGTRVTTYTSASLSSAAPPAGTEGEYATTTVAVGAHQKHLKGGAIGPAVACDTCHVVPADLAHANGGVIVTFGAPASIGGLKPTWNGTTCASTYCHGEGLVGGANTRPTWTGGSSQTTCGSCHGIPPGTPHSTSTSCGSCHDGYSATSVNVSLHLNGKIDATAQHPANWANKDQHGYSVNKSGLSTCKSCHGTDLNGGSAQSCTTCHASAGFSGWATSCTFCHGNRASGGPASPPVDTQGGSAVGNVSVGAHAVHMGTQLMNAPACSACHPDRTGSNVITDAAHIDGNGVAEITFGALARTGGAAATYTRTSATAASCASVYCHGQFTGGASATISWTSTTALSCTSCHGSPPASTTGHPSTTADCGGCHPGYTKTTVNKPTHINGTVESTSQHPANWANKDQHGYSVNKSGLTSCKGCHGTDLNGGSAQSCTTCHASAGFSGWATSCTFCHGNRASGGPASPPVDTQGGSAVTNVSVGAHAAHMGTSLMNTPACSACHPDRTGSNIVTDTAHIDGNGVAEITFGTLARTGGAAATYTRTSATAASCASVYCHGQFTGGASATMSWTSTTALSCTSCHGSPPASSTGHPSTTADCGGCHSGYTKTTVDPATHINGTVESTSAHAANWGQKEQHGYSVNRSGLTSCKSCHGTNLTGGSAQSCANCHGSAWATNCTFCHGNTTSGLASPPVDTQGGSAVTNVSVGAHAKHMGTTLMNTPACSACHPDRTGSNVITDTAHIDGNGIAEVTLGTLARTGGAAATYTRTSATAASCASVYCHGKFTNGTNASGTATPISWTSTNALTCSSCHANPATSGKHSKHASKNVACSSCHGAGYSSSTVNKATHINGTKNLASSTGWNGTSCANSCHGSENW